ncbi:uncharacterized protein MCYG_00892 [Microsporum canis CBS 113480]|uniref:Uncharacterized protein n=1 Tax=Arthroderma otae (strain ATCC MYA-4605 / CBS 113480) TaxID=554155 RepID=C5FDX0_ARTOC|nr:uncharacterized protein MCYG_00892 [Microsporum canis CBS 113480]EEQ28004.1 predicted protein [Microsporum canis CBS 113480]
MAPNTPSSPELMGLTCSFRLFWSPRLFNRKLLIKLLVKHPLSGRVDRERNVWGVAVDAEYARSHEIVHAEASEGFVLCLGPNLVNCLSGIPQPGTCDGSIQ